MAGRAGPPLDERQAVEALLRQLDFHGEELKLIDAELARVALRREEVKRLMTIPGVDATVALSRAASARHAPATPRAYCRARRASRAYGAAGTSARFEGSAAAAVHHYAQEGAHGIKLHSRADGGFANNDPILITPIIEAAAEHDLVVLFHTGEMHFAMPGLLWDLALDFPTVRFICGHMGQWDGFHQAIAMAKRVSNVWLDTTIAWPPNLVYGAVEAVGAERIVYGSDSPYIPAQAEIEKITQWAGLESDEIRLILGENLARVLGVKLPDPDLT